jgi:hypothetical protein
MAVTRREFAQSMKLMGATDEQLQKDFGIKPRKPREPSTKPPAPSEHDEQAALFTWASKNRVLIPDLAWMFAIPNGGARDVITAARLKAEGVKRGVPDICLPVPRGGKHGLFLELKARGGRASPEQQEYINYLLRQGYDARVVVGFEAARDALLEYLGGRKNQ